MAKYYVIVKKETGQLLEPHAFLSDERPIPNDCVYKSFSESDSNYHLVYALFVDDPDRITTTVPDVYIHPALGGVTFDFITNSWVCRKEDLSIDINQLRKMRNEVLNFTDAHTLVPDMAANTMTELLTFRQQLRDMTTKVTDGTWQTKYDVVWPEFPSALKS
jgi:hypothetical protein